MMEVTRLCSAHHAAKTGEVANGHDERRDRKEDAGLSASCGKGGDGSEPGEHDCPERQIPGDQNDGTARNAGERAPDRDRDDEPRARHGYSLATLKGVPERPVVAEKDAESAPENGVAYTSAVQEPCDEKCKERLYDIAREHKKAGLFPTLAMTLAMPGFPVPI